MAIRAAEHVSVAADERRRPLLWVGRAVGVYLASRVVVLIAVAYASTSGIGLAAHRYAGGWPTPPAGPVQVQALGSWDGAWYVYLAGHGYVTQLNPPLPNSGSAAFFPLFPLLIRAVSALTGLGVLYAGVLVTFVVGAVAAVAVWALVRELCDEVTADRAVALWCFFPGAFVLSMVYSTGLTTLLAATCLLCLLRRRWLLAGVAAALATASDPDSLVLVACCAWAAGSALKRHRDWSALVAPVLAPAGAAAYLGFLWVRTGDPLYWYHVEHTIWQGGKGIGFANTVIDFPRTAIEHPGVLTALEPSLGLVVAVVAVVLLVRWRPPFIVALFAVGVIVSALASGPVGARPRFFLVAFPLLVALVRRLPVAAHHAVLGCSALLLGLATVVTLLGLPLTAP